MTSFKYDEKSKKVQFKFLKLENKLPASVTTFNVRIDTPKYKHCKCRIISEGTGKLF